jgi:predicted DNA-binding protein with PD1-like motif
LAGIYASLPSKNFNFHINPPTHALIFQETTRTRRLVGRIEEGEDFVTVLSDLCEEHDVSAGRIEAIGALSQVELARFDPGSGRYKTTFSAEGCFELITLKGNVSRLGDAVVLRLESLLSVAAPAGAQFLSGQVRSARSISCEFVLDIFEDLTIERALDADSGRLNIRSIKRVDLPTDRHEAVDAPAVEASPQAAPAPQPESAPIAGKGLSWKDAAAEAASGADDAKGAQSAQDIYADVNLEEPAMKPGDILEHPKLGRCRVMKVDEGEFAHVRLPRGRIRKLSLEIVNVEFDREEDGRSVFRAIIGR